MLRFKLIYHDQYYLPIGNHVLPADKYRRVHAKLIHSTVADESDFLRPQPASDEDILLVHTPAYVHKLKTGTLSPREELEMEIPYSEELVAAFWLAARGIDRGSPVRPQRRYRGQHRGWLSPCIS
jgi:acetoin utilization deacetylase AcuC-like enzyme